MSDPAPDGSGGPQNPGRPNGGDPIFNVPTIVIALAVAIILIQVLMSWSLGSGNRLHALFLWLGAVRTGASVDQFPAAPLFGLSPLVLHAFIHFGWMHTLVNLGALIAFGSAAARPFGAGIRAGAGFLAFYLACAVSGAVVSSFMHIGEASLMVGASTAVSGLVPAAGWAFGGQAMMWRLALPWLAINGALALAEPFINHSIAWEGHVGGIVMGIIAYPLFLAAFGARRPVA